MATIAFTGDAYDWEITVSLDGNSIFNSDMSGSFNLNVNYEFEKVVLGDAYEGGCVDAANGLLVSRYLIKDVAESAND